MALLASPEVFRSAARAFAKSLQEIFASAVPAQPEDQLKAPVAALLRAVKHGVLTKTEAQVDGLGGRPDIGVEVAGALCGHVELKAPGHGARARDFRGATRSSGRNSARCPTFFTPTRSSGRCIARVSRRRMAAGRS